LGQDFKYGEAITVWAQLVREGGWDIIDFMTTFHGGDLSGVGGQFAIVVSRYNNSITAKLLEGAVSTLKAAGVGEEMIDVAWVPGAFEISLCALKAAVTGKFDAVICLGVIIRGDTPHFDFIAAATAHGITDAGLKTGVPLLFGVITADNINQATARAGSKQDNKGYEAAVAAVEVVNLYKKSFDRQ